MQTKLFNFEIQLKLIQPEYTTFFLLSPKLVVTILVFLLIVCVLYIDITRHYLYVKKFTDNFLGELMRPGEHSCLFRLNGCKFMVVY